MRTRGRVAAGFATVNERLDNLERSIDPRFAQTHETMAPNLAVILAAIRQAPRPDDPSHG